MVLAVLSLSPAATAAEAGAGAPPEAGTADWRSVSSGGNHSCGIRNTGRLYCWGRNSNGQLGNGQLGNGQQGNGFSSPVEVAGGHTDWVSVDLGAAHSCGIRSDRRVYCWGRDNRGQIGNGGPPLDRTTPIAVASFFADWTSVSAGGDTTCARRSNGVLHCWGADSYGLLGNGGANIDRSTPGLVAGGISWLKVAVGTGHVCAVRSNLDGYCWGSDRRGQLGNGGLNSNQGTPGPVAGGLQWSTLVAGGEHSCGRALDRKVYCFGSDQFGQLGNAGTNTDRTTPGRILGFLDDNNWTTVTTGSEHTCARRLGGRLYCWGRDQFGQLGDDVPIQNWDELMQVAGSHVDWSVASAGSFHTCAHRSTGRIYCWGRNLDSQLGDGSATDRPVPVEVEA